MTNISNAKGTCLCGNVTLEANADFDHFGACHCSMCRKWGGGPYLEINCGSDVTLTGEEHVSIYDSSPWAERGFCKNCGTHLFYLIKENLTYNVPLGLFGDSINPEFNLQIFIDKKPKNYSFADKTETLTEEQVFEMYASKE